MKPIESYRIEEGSHETSRSTDAREKAISTNQM